MGEVSNRKGLIGHEAVTAGNAAALDIAESERNNDTVEQRHDPMDRPCEADVQIGPAHRFPEWDVNDKARQDFRQQFMGGTARLGPDDRDFQHFTGIDELDSGISKSAD
jgi:hypothetical protein